MDHTPIGAYRSETPTGWTAHDAQGNARPIGADAAQEVEAARIERLSKKRKGAASKGGAA